MQSAGYVCAALWIAVGKPKKISRRKKNNTNHDDVTNTGVWWCKGEKLSMNKRKKNVETEKKKQATKEKKG